MSILQNFGSYCAALGRDDECGRYANLIRYTRNWLIDIQSLDEGKDEVKLGYVSNYEIFRGCYSQVFTETEKDELSRIVNASDGACRHIGENFRSKILRENILMPSYRARELGSAGLSWLSRRSGRSIREKLAYTNNKLLAVKRRLSLDTGENRLFMAFVSRMIELIDLKGSNATKEERRFRDWGRKLARDDSLSDIGRWENTAPNNTLLSDKNYRAVWRAWQALEKIDDMVVNDVNHLDAHICTVYFWKFLSGITPYCRFCAQPIPYNYVEFKISPHFGNHVVGLSDKGYITIDRAYSDITIVTNNLNLKIKFSNLEAIFIVEDREVSRLEVTPKHFNDIVESSVEILFSDSDKLPIIRNELAVESNGCVYVDVLSVHPRYLTEDNTHGILAKRVLWQTFGEEYELAADDATALYVSNGQKLHSVRASLITKSDSRQFLPDLFRMIGRQIKASQIAIPLPDVYSVFQLAPLRQAVRLHYEQLFCVPQSIAAVVYAINHNILTNISTGDFVIVFDYTYGQVSATMVQCKYIEAIGKVLPETRGFVWERHPTNIKTISVNDIGISADVIAAFGEDGLADEENILAFDLISRWSLMDSDYTSKLKETKYDVTSIIESFVYDHRDMLSSHRVYGILTSPVIFTGKNLAINIPKEAILEGLCTLNKWEKMLASYEENNGEELPPLWSEHLPALAIKRLYGSFSLIGEGDKVEPLLDKPQRIPIPGLFTLQRGQKEFHFGLIMGNDKDISYEAALRHRSFPLKKDIECELNLTYTYGRDNPYELIFIPKNREVQFSQIKAAWEPVSEHPYNNLPFPKFPKPSNSWSELENARYYSKKKGEMVESNFLDWVGDWVNHSFLPYAVFELRDIQAHKRYNGRNGTVNIIKLNMDGKPIVIRMDGDNEELNQGKTNAFSCKLILDKLMRYTTIISKDEWFCPRNGNWMCIKKGLNINGEYKDVAFFPNQFIFEEDFSINNMKVSFYVSTRNDGRSSATNILVEHNEPTRFYRVYADGIFPGVHRYNLRSNVFYPLNQIYSNGVTSNTPECPVYFKETVQKVRDKLLPAFHDAWKYHDYDAMSIFFRVMCIMVKDIGREAYDQIPNVLTYQPNIIDEDCGCSLGDYDQGYEQMTLNAILGAKISDLTLIGILSRAAWKSDGFIQNMNADILLAYYEKAIDYLEKIDKVAGRLEKSVLWCFEYILAIFRLRERNDATINHRLSLNNAITKKLVDAIENFIDAGSELPYSRVKIELKKANDEYRNIHRLMYAILVYINGGADDITITGISEEDD